VEGDVQLIEGAGGLFVPLNNKSETWADFLAETGVPVIVVALAGLGTLNHTSLTIEALQRREVPILGIVLNGETHEANQESLKRMLPQHAIHAFPNLPELDQHADWEKAAGELTSFLVAAVENAALTR